MAMRRPRIKAQANIQLNGKRKPKPIEQPKPNNKSPNYLVETIENIPAGDKEEQIERPVEQKTEPHTAYAIADSVEGIVTTAKEVISCDGRNAIDTKACSENNIMNATNNVNCDNNVAAQRDWAVTAEAKNKLLSGSSKENLNHDTEQFKFPPKVEFQRSVSHTSNSGADDVFYSDIEENAMHLDIQRSPNGHPMSPSRNQTRQRIKATPIFGQRRNSFLASSPNPYVSGGGEDYQNCYNGVDAGVVSQRRERHISASLSIASNSSSSSHHHHHKYLPNGSMGRMRTESGCSVFSDINVSNHKNRKTDDHKINLKLEFESRFANGVPDKSCLKMSDLIYYNPASNPMEQKPYPVFKNENNDSNASVPETKPFKEKKVKITDSADNDSAAMPVPQLKLDSNGELILDDKSLIIETTAEQEARKVLANTSLIYLDENTGMNGFYTRQKRTREWQSSETVKFYRCLQTIGTDFSLMVTLFPNRSRRDLKLKFKKEERINGNLINKALLYPKQFNIEDLKQQIQDEDKRREDEINRFKQLKEAASKEFKKRKFVRSSADCALNNGNIYQNEWKKEVKKPRNSSQKMQTSETGIRTIETDVELTLSKCNNKGNANADGIVNKTGKVKRRRRNVPQKVDLDSKREEIQTRQPSPAIKVEAIKNEPELKQTKFEPISYHQNDNSMEVEGEMNELSHSEMNDCNGNHMHNIAITPEIAQTESPVSFDSTTLVASAGGFYEEDHENMDDCENRTFVNLDDGSVTIVTDVHSYVVNSLPRKEESSVIIEKTSSQSPAISQPTPSPSPPCTPISTDSCYPGYQTLSSEHISAPDPDFINQETCSSEMSERELNESDIQKILTELSEGSLFLVSTLNPDDPDQVINEIFMVDKNTGDLCDEPLNIPDNIVQCILSVMS